MPSIVMLAVVLVGLLACSSRHDEHGPAAAPAPLPCGDTTCTASAYCVTTMGTGGADTDPPRELPADHRCVDTPPPAGGSVTCEAPVGHQIRCVASYPRADAPGVRCGDTTCGAGAYCLTIQQSGGVDEDPPHRVPPTLACADALPVSQPGTFTCDAPVGRNVRCVHSVKRAEPAPAAAAAAPSRRASSTPPVARVACGTTSCAPTEFCITTAVTGGARDVAEQGRAPSYRCAASAPPAGQYPLECDPPRGHQVGCTLNAK